MAVNFESKFPSLDTGVLELATGLQEIILQIFPMTIISEDADNVGYGYGSGYKDLVYAISPFKAHVNLGNVNGASLDEPHQLMSGKGKVHRHIKVSRGDQLRDPNLNQLMQQALESRPSTT